MELRGFEPRTEPCHGPVIPLHHSPRCWIFLSGFSLFSDRYRRLLPCMHYPNQTPPGVRFNAIQHLYLQAML